MQLLSSHLNPCLRSATLRNSADHINSLVSFSQLQKQIIDLAATHFKHLPVRPPHEDLAQVPHNLPSFLGDTPASRFVQYGRQTDFSLTDACQTSSRCVCCAHGFQADHVPCLRTLPVQSWAPLRQGRLPVPIYEQPHPRQEHQKRSHLASTDAPRCIHKQRSKAAYQYRCWHGRRRDRERHQTLC